ncbi:WhiB family transcriptional regulator [Streptomyces sp. Lzd4kr]|nr:WhiB family transcriptional regulator [Streptomyces sp. Lzd4kr]
MVSRSEDWRERAVCRSTDAEALFLEGVAQEASKHICRPCPVRTECLVHALDERIEHGVWGGMTERERRALLRRRPGVTSWGRLLKRTRTDQDGLPAAQRSTSAP